MSSRPRRVIFASPSTWCGQSLVRRCCHCRSRRSQGNQCTPPRWQLRGSTSAKCCYHHRFGQQRHSHCRRRSSPRRHRYRHLRAHRYLSMMTNNSLLSKDGDYDWSSRRRPPQQAAEFWRPQAGVFFQWGPRLCTTF